jgi:hypothetical protein
VTWLASNPIYLRANDPPPAPITFPPAQQTWRVAEGPGQWIVEHEHRSATTAGIAPLVDPAGPAVELRFTLRAGERGNQYAALVTSDVASIAQATRLSFTAWADRPMRMSVQLRAPTTGEEGDRWQRSVYVDSQKRTTTIAFDDMTGVWPAPDPHPRLANIRTLMFVVDMTNTLPGASGRLAIGSVKLER